MHLKLSAFVAFTLAAVVRSTSSSTVSSDSCQSETCAETLSEKGQALLQASSKKVKVKVHGPGKVEASTLMEKDSKKSGVNESAPRRKSGVNPSGAAAPLDEVGYSAVADRCCQAEMNEFITRQIQELGYEVCEESGLYGIIPYHSCEKGPQTFAKLTSDLLDDGAARCTWLAKTGQCQPIPEDCPTFGGIMPSADCGCSRSEAATIITDAAKGANLVENNLGGLGPTTGPEEFRIREAGTSSTGEVFDVVITALTAYEAIYPQYNGIYAYGAINISPKSATFAGEVTFNFAFTKPGTYDPVEVSEVHMAIFDLDGTDGGGGLEFAASKGYKGYVTDTAPNVVASRLEDGRTQFTSEGTNNNIQNPSNPMALTDEQRKNSVMYFFTGCSNFELTFGIDGTSNGAGRYLFFAFESALNERCGD